MLIRLVDGDEFKEFRIEEGDMFLLPGMSHPLWIAYSIALHKLTCVSMQQIRLIALCDMRILSDW